LSEKGKVNLLFARFTFSLGFFGFFFRTLVVSHNNNLLIGLVHYVVLPNSLWEMAIGMDTADAEINAGKVVCCEYAKVVTGLGEFELSVGECGGQSCAQSIFSNPLIYEKCPQRLKYQKDGVIVNQSETKKVLVRVTSKQASTPKFTGAGCNGCQYKGGSYCWGQCTYNIWKRKPDW
jgi:hypothetical protein